VFSKTGSSPTKLGEYLAAGLPVIVNAGVGDTDTLVESTRVGVVVGQFSLDEYARKWEEFSELSGDPDVRARCRATARQFLGLDIGIGRYREVYDALLTGSARRPGPSPRDHSRSGCAVC
jgi:hypothetical protein